MRSKKREGLVCLALVFFVVAFSGAASGEEKPAAGNAASVNGVPISNEDVNRQMFALEQHLLSTQGMAIRPEMVPELRDKVLDELINKELLYQESLRQGIEVADSAVDERMAALKERFPDEKAFLDEMRQMNFSEDTLRLQIKKDMTIQELMEKEIAAKVQVSDDDSKRFYDANLEIFSEKEKVRASHILIRSEADTDPLSKDERRGRLEGIKERIEKGEDFAALAEEFSQCPSSERGGDLGYFERGRMVKPFEDAAFSLKAGEVSDIVVTPFGFHLIKVTDRREARTISYEESKERIEQHLKGLKLSEEKKLYIGELERKSKVERY